MLFLIEILGLIGAWIIRSLVWLLTLGRVDLETEVGGESVFWQFIGFYFLLLAGGLVAWWIHRV